MLADNNIVDINVTDVEVAGAFFTRKTHNAIYVHLPIKRHIGFVMLIQANNHLTTIIRKLRVKFKKKLLNADLNHSILTCVHKYLQQCVCHHR